MLITNFSFQLVIKRFRHHLSVIQSRESADRLDGTRLQPMRMPKNPKPRDEWSRHTNHKDLISCFGYALDGLKGMVPALGQASLPAPSGRVDLSGGLPSKFNRIFRGHGKDTRGRPFSFITCLSVSIRWIFSPFDVVNRASFFRYNMRRGDQPQASSAVTTGCLEH